MSWRGYGVAQEVHQKAPKLTKVHQSGFHSMTAKYFDFALSDYCDPFFGLNGHLKVDKSQSKPWWGHGGVMGSHMGCTKTHQNASKWSP